MVQLLQVKDSRLSVDLAHGAALTNLELDGMTLLKPMPGYHYEASLLFPFPNRLANGSYRFEGKDYVFAKNDFGRPNALHGFIHDMAFQVKESTASQLDLILTHGGDRSEFPFPFSFSISYALGERSLDISVSVENTGLSNLPFGFGWHPYFLLRDKKTTRLKLPASKKIEVDENLIPTGEKLDFNEFVSQECLVGHELDNCFAFTELHQRYATFLELAENTVLELWQDDQFRYLQVFTPGDDLTVALEPMTCNIDALNNGEGLMVIAPGTSWSGSFGLRVKK